MLRQTNAIVGDRDPEALTFERRGDRDTTALRAPSTAEASCGGLE
jgi:hypothetical protein